MGQNIMSQETELSEDKLHLSRNQGGKKNWHDCVKCEMEKR